MPAAGTKPKPTSGYCMRPYHLLFRCFLCTVTGIFILSAGLFPAPSCLAKNIQTVADPSLRKSGEICGSLAAQLPRERMLRHLKRFLAYVGTPYRSGGTGASGIDCSGLVQRYCAEVYGVQLPHSAYLQSRSRFLEKVPNDPNAFRPGDLLFFKTRSKRINHVAIYISDGKFLHATNSGGVIISRVNESYWRKRLAAARRAPDSIASLTRR